MSEQALSCRRGPYRYITGGLDLIQNAYRRNVAVLTGRLRYVTDFMVAGALRTNERLPALTSRSLHVIGALLANKRLSP